MAVRPVLFNTEMVKAILSGKKTQTRRVVKCNDSTCNLALHSDVASRRFIEDSSAVRKLGIEVGDVLWVRETWDNIPVSPERKWIFGGMYYYKADGDIRPSGWRGNWRPSIHMPRKAARIFLRVIDVRVERLHDITEEQAVLEGFHAGCHNVSGGPWGVEDDPETWTAVDDFSRLWDKTIPKNPCKFKRHPWYWKDNPWVWVITFEKCKKPEGLWEDLYETD